MLTSPDTRHAPAGKAINTPFSACHRITTSLYKYHLKVNGLCSQHDSCIFYSRCMSCVHGHHWGPGCGSTILEDELVEAAPEIKQFPYRKPRCTEVLKMMDSAEVERWLLPLAGVVMEVKSRKGKETEATRLTSQPG